MSSLPAQAARQPPPQSPLPGTGPQTTPAMPHPVRDGSELAATDELGAARSAGKNDAARRACGTGLSASPLRPSSPWAASGVGAYVANQNDPLNQVLQASDVRQATVDVNGGGTATVSISPSRDAAVVKMNGVPRRPRARSTRCG